MSIIELLQWWRWNQFVSFEFWWQKSCCYCLCQSWCCYYNDTMLPNNDTKYFHSRWSLSIGLACRSASPLGLGGETVTGSILQSVLGGVILLKIHNSFEWVAMFRTKRKKEAIHYNAHCTCFSAAISQRVLVYMAPNSKIFRTEVRIESPISSQFTTSQHWAHSSRQNPSTKPSQILDWVHTGSGVRTHQSRVTNVRWSLAIMRELSSI